MNATYMDYFNSGNAKANQADYRGAIEDFNEVIKLKSDYAEAYYIRGIAKSKTLDFQGAIMDFNKVIELKSNDLETFHKRRNTKNAPLVYYPETIVKFGKHKGKTILQIFTGDKKGLENNMGTIISQRGAGIPYYNIKFFNDGSLVPSWYRLEDNNEGIKTQQFSFQQVIPCLKDNFGHIITAQDISQPLQPLIEIGFLQGATGERIKSDMFSEGQKLRVEYEGSPDYLEYGILNPNNYDIFKEFAILPSALEKLETMEIVNLKKIEVTDINEVNNEISFECNVEFLFSFYKFSEECKKINENKYNSITIRRDGKIAEFVKRYLQKPPKPPYLSKNDTSTMKTWSYQFTEVTRKQWAAELILMFFNLNEKEKWELNAEILESKGEDYHGEDDNNESEYYYNESTEQYYEKDADFYEREAYEREEAREANYERNKYYNKTNQYVDLNKLLDL